MKISFLSTVALIGCPLGLSAAQNETTSSSTTAPSADLESFKVGRLEMQIGSRTSADSNDVLLDTLSVTVNFLDGHFREHFLGNSSALFEKISLTVSSYAWKSNDSGNIAQIVFSGLAFFHNISLPEPSEVTGFTSSTFKQDNQGFLKALMSYDNPFLQDVTYAIVKVDGDVNGEGDPASSIKGDDSMEVWMIALLAGGSAFGFVVCFCLIFICCTPASVTDGEKPNVGVNGNPSLSKTHRNSRKTEEESSANQSRSPSPMKSIASQESSCFTFNPQSCRSHDSKTVSSFLAGNGVDVDVEAWRKGSTVESTQVPFGQDISAIENKKDLSLIAEAEDEDVTPQNNGSIDPSYLSESNLQSAERGQSKKAMIRKFPQFRQFAGSPKNVVNLNSSATDVIKDLKDLSFQIDHYRRR